MLKQRGTVKSLCHGDIIRRLHSQPVLLPQVSTPFLLVSVPRPSGQLVLGGHEDQRDLFVCGAEQRKHPLCELRGSSEAVDLRARLHVIEGHLTFVHVQEHAHLTQLQRTLHLQRTRTHTHTHTVIQVIPG